MLIAFTSGSLAGAVELTLQCSRDDSRQLGMAG